MSGSIVLPGEVGSQIEPHLTVDGIRHMIRDLRDRKQRIPNYILLSEYDRRDLNQDILGASVGPVSKEDQKPEHDNVAVGIIEGVMVRSHPEVPRGKARLVYGPVIHSTNPGTGKIIVGA